jgi:hypothetical protein
MHPSAAIRVACAKCGANKRVSLKACSKCHVARYCSVACQRADWTKEGSHRMVCADMLTETLWKPTSATSGVCVMSVYGMPWPMTFGHARHIAVYTKQLNMESFELVSFKRTSGGFDPDSTGDFLIGFCDESGAVNGRHHVNDNLCQHVCANRVSGPVVLCHSNVGTDEELELTNDALFGNRLVATHHRGSRWPLTKRELAGKAPSLALEAQRDVTTYAKLIPAHVWHSLWHSGGDTAAWWHAPMIWNDRPVPLNRVLQHMDPQRAANFWKAGAIVRRIQIADPSVAPCTPPTMIDVVEHTVLAQGPCDDQAPGSVAHFDSTGLMVRCQANCYQFCMEDNGNHYREMAHELEDAEATNDICARFYKMA